VAGKLAARYGQQRASGVNWDGVVVATEKAASVRAVAAGRVVYSDWLPGLGLLAIVDHGGGYLSLYGYNEALRHAVGDMVERGEVIAAAGDTGGRSRPELYFEIRRAGRPIDPLPWFRDRAP
jgi:murein hydrolase activator